MRNAIKQIYDLNIRLARNNAISYHANAMNLVPLQPHQESQARKLLADAMPVAQIARAIGVPYWRVYRMTFNNPSVKLTVGRPRKTPSPIQAAPIPTIP